MRGMMIAATAMLATGCNGVIGGAAVEASGVNGQRSFDAAGFDQVGLSGPFDVNVTVGGAASVRADGDTGLIDKMEVKVEGGKLSIGLQPGYTWSGDGARVTVQVSLPSLAAADIAGSGDMRVSAFQAQRFTGGIAGSGTLRLDELQADSATFDIAGSGDIEASGTAREAGIGIAGSGNARLANLQAERARVSIAGSGDAAIKATGTANIEIVGSGDVTVTGGARCEVSRVGSGDAHCG